MSANNGSVVVAVPTQWTLLDDLRDIVLSKLEGWSQDAREAVAMVASELLENAVKYGEPLPQGQEAQLRFAVEGDVVRLEVTSGLGSQATFEELHRRVSRIESSSDKRGLYVRRMQEIYEHPTASAGLGLYRIAFEGGFSLTCSWQDGMLTMVATRGLQGASPLGR